MDAIGKILLIFGLVGMLATFVLALYLYSKNERLELAVMSFALAAAITISGVTATLLGRFNERRMKAAEKELKNAQIAAEAKALATNATWFSQPDGTYIHADGSSGARTASPAVPDAAPAPGAQSTEPPAESPGEAAGETGEASGETGGPSEGAIQPEEPPQPASGAPADLQNQ